MHQIIKLILRALNFGLKPLTVKSKLLLVAPVFKTIRGSKTEVLEN